MLRQDVQVLPLIRDNALWTMGADSMDIDWEAAWKQRLREVPTASMGSGAPLSTNVTVDMGRNLSLHLLTRVPCPCIAVKTFGLQLGSNSGLA